MQTNFKSKLKGLLSVAYTFNTNSAIEKVNSFKDMQKQPFVIHKSLFEYHVLLLFTLTHAENPALVKIAEAELQRLTNFIKKNANHALFADSGLPYTTMLTRFTQDAFNDLAKNKQVHIELESLNNSAFDLNTFLNITMPHVLKEYTTAGMSNNDLLATLGVKAKHEFQFLLQVINNVNAPPLIKDLLWQSLQSFFYVKGLHKNYSKAITAFYYKTYFYHHELVKQFDHFELINKKIPKAASLSIIEKEKIAFVIRNSMPLAMREIDTITYLDINSLQVFHLERGLTLALYVAKPERQLPMQSFVGYSLFKNGYPVSYGGSWIFGECSLFGLNILEEFRGGESKYIMTQILRVYIRLYHISYYEIETFQFGNHEALETGAFWFYYKYGFRSKNKGVNQLAEKEIEKIKANKNYKTSISTLEKLSEYNIALQLKGILRYIEKIYWKR
ncbi:MAG: hypothetical protein IPP48_08400 [Chitinophagaceae bacterium]|nr:hypothetical protein [Chitinophagaceae bacterium]